MAFVSFPLTKIDHEERIPTIYDKVYSAATHVLYTFRNEDSHSQTKTYDSNESSQSQQSESSQDSNLRSRSNSTNHFRKQSFTNVAMNTDSDSGSRPQLLRTSTTSSATVGVSAALAVPLLPSSSSPSDLGTVMPSSNEGGPNISSDNASRASSITVGDNNNSNNKQFDVESMFSVNSTSASRAYLASQYSRTRSRAAPGRLSREFWMKDESAISCFNCNRQFTTFRRKHHCRVCGQIFCSACTQLIDGELCGSSKRRVRCCRSCEDALVSHSSSDDDCDLSIQSHLHDESMRFPDTSSSVDDGIPLKLDIGVSSNGISTGIETSSYDGGYHNDYYNDGKTENYSRLSSPIGTDDTHFARSFLGTSHSSHLYRSRSRSLSRARSQSQFVDDTSTTRSNNANTYGSLSSASPFSTQQGYNSSNTLVPPLNTSSVVSANNTGNVNMAGALSSSLTNASGYISAANLHSGDDFPLSTAIFPNSVSVELNNASLTYLQLFLNQLLRDSELDPEEWQSILTAPLLEVAAGLHLEINDRLSPREWVKVKQIPGGTPHDIDCINGTVFTHSLARKSMAQILKHPRILLMAFPIEYTRNERYMSLEPVVAQEKEFLRKLVARIVALKPDLLLSCSYVCGQALGMLEAAGVSVAQNVRESALFRLSKITKSDILITIDRLNAAPQLGTCESFEQRSYRHGHLAKTFLFFFVKKADPGRCALVRGNPETSGVVKVVLEVMAEICYSLKAETALMRDQFVMVPSLTSPPSTILSSSPFVDYGTPYLQQLARKLEDEVVELGNKIDTSTSREKKYILNSKLEVTRDRWIETARTWDSIEVSSPFMFNPSSHQNLVVLYSLVNSETVTPCVGPDAQLIEFYLNTDQTLGKFVESSIEQVDSPCPDCCGITIFGHYRTYVNGNGMVTVYTEKMPCKVPGLEDSILMWSYCQVCEQQMPIAPMSSTTWKCSMGKYLELCFYGQPLKMRASSCDHNVYRDHIRYFGWHGYALKIQYSTIQLNEIYGPPKLLKWNPEMEVDLKQSTYRELDQKLHRFWSSTIESLSKVKVEGLEEKMIETSKIKIEELKSRAEIDRSECKALLDRINEDTLPYDYLSLNKVLETYQKLVDQWHIDLADFDGQFFPTERDIRRVTAQHIRGLLGEDMEKPKSTHRPSFSSRSNDKTPIDGIDCDDDDDVKSVKSSSTTKMSPPVGNKETPVPPLMKVGADELDPPSAELARSVPATGSHIKDLLHYSDNSLPVVNNDNNEEKDKLLPSTPQKSADSYDVGEEFENKSGLSVSPSIRVKSKSGNDINLSMPGMNQSKMKDGNGRVAILARHFEELSREFEKERQKEKQRLKDRQRAIQMRHAHPIAEVFEDVSEAIEDWPQAQQGRLHHSRSKSQSYSLTPTSSGQQISVSSQSPKNLNSSNSQIEPTAMTPPIQTDTSGNIDKGAVHESSDQLKYEYFKKSHEEPASPNAEDKDAEEIKKVEPVKLSLIKTLANFWAERSSTRWNGIEYVLGTREHYFTNSFVVLRESEPSSLIAFCLSLPDYKSRVNEFYENTPGIASDYNTVPSEAEGDKINANDGNRNSMDYYLEHAMLRQTGTHMRYHFDRNNVKVSCKIFFSEQFDAMRRKCTVSDKYIQSLSRCSTWDSTGGKSGSAFLKTLDDRLILKELSHAEFDSFVTFAPSYFEYMSQALFHELPTFLAKIYGVYQITIRNSQTSQQVKMYVLVMENLFYGAKFSKFFDLKGSMRNRKVTETGKANEVLLDENMVEYIYETPVFVREHSKRMLRASLYNDTLFLTKMNVMDYSLVIGLDDEHNIIVAGIIDYIRTYTWDKKIESWVKTRAATVGIKEPTVVSPKQYKGRFRESMERYFVEVPDCWSQQSI